MKHILARGGIEFLAVLLGITGSLLIDEKKNDQQLISQVNSSLHALRGEMETNIANLEKFKEFFPKALPMLDFVIRADSLEYLSEKDLDLYSQRSATNWGSKLNDRVFNSMEASGLIYKITNDSLRSKILDLYQDTYERYAYLLDYDLTHIQKFDDISLLAFELRDDSVSTNWAIDWQNKNNFIQFKDNVHVRNFLIANRGTKRLMRNSIPRILKKTKAAKDIIDNHLRQKEQ
ncbi:MAG: hypothetical protein HOL60_08245 [Pelagibacteraceae bacterium]|jgi:hypothetical protein|nr:hypothetical protein [Candidatus Neomarinimicrobiota bacterium]MBT5214539.1 hypothetical protein [Pelagibacteraceae bacterium]